MQYGIAFTPLVPTIVLWIALAAIVAIAVLLLLGRSRGAAVRVAALALILLALANPSFTREDREPLSSVSRLALFALAIQFALSFGHFHADVARAAPALQTGLADADLATALAAPGGHEAAQQQQPSNHDTDRQRPTARSAPSSRWPTISCSPRRRCWSCRRRSSFCT